MRETLLYSRLQFGLTVIVHYLFPQLTMSLAVLVAWFRVHEEWGDRREHYRRLTAFWTKILALTFVFGVVTGIPLEFQFGTNWAAFSRFAGGVIGQTLALEGVFAFFLETTFLSVMLAGPERVGRTLHLLATLLVAVGAWVSAYFILATNAWMQHPVAWARQPDGSLSVDSIFGLLGNRWLLWQYPHNQSASMVTGSFVLAAVGAFYLLARRHEEIGRTCVRTGVFTAAAFSCLMIYPTGDGASRQVFFQQGPKAAAMEGHFHTEPAAPLVLIGQPDMEHLELQNPIYIPKTLSFLTYRRFSATVPGLDAYPRDRWPDNVPLVYYAYHIMIGLGVVFVIVMLTALALLRRRRLYASRWMLWVLMLATPFPYVATTAGWVTAEAGRQPWIAWELMRTHSGVSPVLNSGNAMFTLLGFTAISLILGVAYLMLCFRLIAAGPKNDDFPEDEGREE
jgi:cytochrome d ubiquinol oxidase subunit I